MELATVQNVIANVRKGTNIVLEWQRPVKVKTAFADRDIQKYVRMIGRVGIDYNNQEIVKQKRSEGELPSQEKPIWNGKGEWVIFPYLFRHVDTDEQYVRLYASTSESIQPVVEWLIDGDVVDFEDVEPMLMASEKNSEKGDCFCCKMNNILRIADEADWLAEVEDEIPATTTPIETAEPVE